MFRLGFFLSVVVVAFAAPLGYEDIPQEIKAMLPPNMAEIIKSITPEEKKAVEEVLTNISQYKTEEEVMAAIKAKSPSLFEKAKKLHDILEQKFKAVGPEGQAYLKKIKASMTKLHKTLLAGKFPSREAVAAAFEQHKSEYHALSPTAKTDLKTHFPILSKMLARAFEDH